MDNFNGEKYFNGGYRGESYPRQRTPWGIREFVIVILLVFLIDYLFSIVVHMVGIENLSFIPGISPRLLYFILVGLVQTIALVTLTMLFIHIRGGSLNQAGLRSCRWQDFFLTGVLGGLLVLFLVTTVMLVITSLVNQTPAPQPFTEMVKEIRHPAEMATLLLLGGVIAPFGEEFYFRGFVYPALRRYGILPALLITSGFFGAMHFDLLRFIPLSLGGLFLALIAEKSHSLLPSWAAHATWNLAMTIIMIVGGKSL